MKDINKNSGFTFIELIVTTIILVILVGTGFYSYIGYLGQARDSERTSDLAKLSSSLKLYKQKRGSYPIPGKYFIISNSGATVAYQGELNTDVTLSTLDKLPSDPFTKTNYKYSVTSNKQEYQIALTYENGDFPKTGLEGDYKSVSKNVLPNIILAKNSKNSVEIHSGVLDGSINRNYILFNSSKNLPYELIDPYRPYYDSSLLDTVLLDTNTDFWQNTDYRSCIEIYEAGKSISLSGALEEYQILNGSGVLTNTGCTL